MNKFSYRWRQAFLESGHCIALGFRDAAAFSLLWRSAVLSIAATLIWAWIYFHFSAEISELVIVLSTIACLGVLAFGFPGGAAAPMGGSVTAMGSIPAGLVQLAQILIVIAAVMAALYVLIYLLAVASTVRLALPRMILPSALRKVGHRYPAANSDTESADDPTGPRSGWKLVLLFIAGLFVPMLAGMLLLLAACYVNVRLIYSRFARHSADRDAMLQSLGWRWRPLLLIGVAMLLLLAVPVVNLLVPALMCTAVLHLGYRDNRFLRASLA